jgi:hypothetical protein
LSRRWRSRAVPNQVIYAQTQRLSGARICRIAGVERSHTYSLVCMPLTVAAIAASVLPSGSRTALNADYALVGQAVAWSGRTARFGNSERAMPELTGFGE